MIKSLPDLVSEKALWEKGFGCVAGVDEVGRGAWAGPVVAAAVVFDAGGPLLGGPPTRVTPHNILIDDSKRLSATQRELAAEWIRDNCAAWGIGVISSGLINSIGMAKSSKMVFRRAIADCNKKIAQRGWKIDYLLIDAFYIPYVRGVRRNRQTAIIKGDQKSISIAAASIIAKVYRDQLMQKLGIKYPDYNWESNKGYGTKEHQNEILRNGLTYLHRKQFVESWRNKLQ